MSAPLPPEPDPLRPADASPEPEPTDGGRTPPGWKTWLTAGAVAVVIVVIGAAVMSRSGGDDAGSSEVETSAEGDDSVADDSGQGPGAAGFRGAAGTVTKIDGASLVVETTDDSSASTPVTVETTDDTVVTETVAGSLSDLTVGDNVVVTGEEADGGGMVADAVTDSGELEGGFGGPGGGRETPPEGSELPDDFEPPEDFEPPADGQGPPGAGDLGGFASGEITSIDAAAMTIETADGETVTVSLASDPEVSVTRSLTMDALVVGDSVRVVGETSGSTVTASSIQRGESGFPGGTGVRPEDGSSGDDSTGSSS